MNELTIIPQNDGFLASSDEKSIFFPNAELSIAGCRNCIWKLHSQCPYGLKDDEFIEILEFDEKSEFHKTKTFKIHSQKSVVPDSSITNKEKAEARANEILQENHLGYYGICPEMISFLTSLSKHTETTAPIWERFHIYKAQIQESVDYADFVNLTKKVKEDEIKISNSIPTDSQLEMLDRLKMDRNAAKLWWARLNQHVITSMQKINDRESKQSDTPRLAGIHSSGTINFNIKNEIKQLEGK